MKDQIEQKNLKDLRICQKCVMIERKPDVYLNEKGICNLCIEYDRSINSYSKPLETDFINIINKYKGKHKYDCLVMCSGGKDSTSSLYYMKKRYGLNILAFTFDHGFETEEALANVRNAVEILNVDFMYFKSNCMHGIFKKILESGSKAVVCHPCSIWYMDLAFDVAAKYDIPIIVAGWTKGQSAKQPVMSRCGCNTHLPEFRAMGEATVDFLNREVKNMPEYKNFPRSMDEVLKRANSKHKAIVISPLWFLPFGPETYVKVIKKELKWKVPKVSYPKGSTNCLLNFISVYNSMKYFGYTHYHVEMSKLIREGVITREEALTSLRPNYNKKLLNSIAKKLNFQFS